MQRGSATIVIQNAEALRVTASAARISTQPGTALEIFQKSIGDGRDLRLVGKVLASGHKSLVEHQTVSIAFDNVSVLVEQFLIEFRLASFTVKSRRYVDFSQAGYVTPDGLSRDLRDRYDRRAQALFALYDRLIGLGIPREDARFVLPYCFRSNFYVTTNARELINIVCAMLYGRGSRFQEIFRLGLSLKEQFDAMYPGVLDAERENVAGCAAEPLPDAFARGTSVVGGAELVSAPDAAGTLLNSAVQFSGRDVSMDRIVCDARPRELEMLQYVFRVRNASLACVTHFARHRMQSPIFRFPVWALATGNYVLPRTIRENAGACEAYEDAFRAQTDFAREMAACGLSREDCGYLAMSGHTCDILLAMNARELLHFFKLRTCSRAQWEIRLIALEMLKTLRAREPEIFRNFGASCYVTGRCPEGRLSCGKPWKREENRT